MIFSLQFSRNYRRRIWNRAWYDICPSQSSNTGTLCSEHHSPTHSIAYLQFLSFHIHLIASHTCNSYHFIFISFHRIPAILIISYSSHSISCQCMPCHFMSSHAFFILIPSHSIQIVLKLIPVHVISMSSHAIETHQILSYPSHPISSSSSLLYG